MQEPPIPGRSIRLTGTEATCERPAAAGEFSLTPKTIEHLAFNPLLMWKTIFRLLKPIGTKWRESLSDARRLLGPDRFVAYRVRPLPNTTMSSRVRLRRSPWIISYWHQNQLIYENYLTRVRISAAPFATVVLDFFDRWKDPEELVSDLAGFSPASIRRTLARLTALSFLEEEGKSDPRSEAMRGWEDWSPEASFFHFVTKDIPYQKVFEFDRRAARQYLRKHPQPPFFKRYPNSQVIQLDRDSLATPGEFPRVLHERRTWREFSRQKLPLQMLAQLLQYTWGVTHYVRDDLLGKIPLKTSPSGGARHPIEVYVVTLRVEGLPQGLYHYASDRHVLECLRHAPMKGRAICYLGEQWWFGEAAAVFLMTAVFPRTMWKYNYSRVYRSVLLDAGHLCQTFCLTATSLGLAPFCTMALADSLIEKDVGADGITESAIYAAGVGVRPKLADLLYRRDLSAAVCAAATAARS